MDSNQCDLFLMKQSAKGVIPAAPLTKVRFTGESLVGRFNRSPSNEIVADGQISELFTLGAEQSGGFNFEFAASAASGSTGVDTVMNDLLLGVLMASGWSVAPAVIPNLDDLVIADAAIGSSITTTAGSFSSLVPGSYIKLSGCTTKPENNRIVRIATAGGKSITVYPALAACTEAGDVTIKSSSFIYNQPVPTKHRFTIERLHRMEAPNSNVYFQFRDLVPSQFTLNISAQQIITGSYSFMGGVLLPVSDTTCGTGAVIPANTNIPMNGTANVAKLILGTAELTGAYANSLSITIGKNIRAINEIGQLWAPEIGTGSWSVTGSLGVLFTSKDLYEMYVNNTASRIIAMMTDSAGNSYIFTIERVKFSDGSPNVGGKDQDVALTLNWQGLKGTDFNRTIQIDFIPA